MNQNTAAPTNLIAVLDDLGLIEVSGDDAASFLHNQLTNDVEHLGLDEARLAGYCSPKGRLLATMLMWRTADAIYLQLPRDIQPAIQKRLQMFVLRAKVRIADATNAYVMVGVIGAKAPGVFPTLPAAPYSAGHSDYGSLIRLPDSDGQPRGMWITSPVHAQEMLPLIAGTLQPASPAVWRLSDIHAGIPQITAATQEKFVPQMINYELIGGVNFKKGCYPGQEIVARSQYLGKLKRRTLLARVDDTEAKAGMEVFSAADPDQPCGMIVNAEANGAESSSCLVEVKLAAVEAGAVHLGSNTGNVLQFAELPYPLIDPV
jgi:folate-binding protein YgfZ